MSKLLYIVFSNVTEGKMFIKEVEENSNWSYQSLGGYHSNNVFESYSKEECEKYIEEAEENSKIYKVFWDKVKDYCWVEEFDCNSGTEQARIWACDNPRDISIIKEFNKRKEAEEYCRINNEEVI